MINRLKQIKITKKWGYISLAICMLLIGGIGIFNSIRNMQKVISESDIEYEQISNESTVKLPLQAENIDNLIPELSDIKETSSEPLNFIMPVDGEIKCEFSGTELVYSQTMNDYRTHNGIDIFASDGTSVVCAESGKIVNIVKHPLWGMSIEVEHENGFKTCYRNLSENLPEGIEIGSFVSAGGILGTVGETALVEIGEEPHLHFEMYCNSQPVDPAEYVD